MNSYNKSQITGFTLIELLITVAIIAILAAIGLPNFLEAQTRAKVSQVKSDMRTLAAALESYHVDNRSYPPAVLTPPEMRLLPLTSPIQYLSLLPKDTFRKNNSRFSTYNYGAMPILAASRWILDSCGPDLTHDTDPMTIEFYPGNTPGLFFGADPNFYCLLYDPTNGTVSAGDIYRANDFNN